MRAVILAASTNGPSFGMSSYALQPAHGEPRVHLVVGPRPRDTVAFERALRSSLDHASGRA